MKQIIIFCLILNTIQDLLAQGINWQAGEGGVSWALACDFSNNDMGSAQVSGEKCGMTCINTQGCTHFSWNNYNGGTCWMKKLSTIQKSNAIFNNNYDMVCGILYPSSNSPTGTSTSPSTSIINTLTPSKSLILIWSDEFNYNGLPDST